MASKKRTENTSKSVEETNNQKRNRKDFQVVIFEAAEKDYDRIQFEQINNISLEAHIHKFKNLCVLAFANNCKDFLVYGEGLLNHQKYDDDKSTTDLCKIKRELLNALRFCNKKANEYWSEAEISNIKTLNEYDEKTFILYNKLFSDMLERVLHYKLDDADYCILFLTKLFTVDFIK